MTGRAKPGDKARNSINDIWGARTPFKGNQWRPRVDELVEAKPDRWVQSACVLCSNGCGIDIGVKNDRIVGVRGRAADRVNRGRLGPKGLHGWQANHHPDRLQFPLIRENGELRQASWDEAMKLIVSRSEDIIERYSGSAIGFYTTGQLFLEEYYTLALIARGGIGTPHVDGNTRLCTATAERALEETFGADGQPGSYRDIDLADCILHVGHNIAETDTVLWMRVLDRRRGAKPPKLIAIDIRKTPTTREADIHLAPRPGTNVALLNGLLHLIIKSGAIDRDFVADHTLGFEQLRETVAPYTPSYVEEITGVPAAKIKAAARVLSDARRLVSTVLQGVYQSNQSTAAACQVNNINLVRGMIGKPGCGILQMNGQPTAQNTRECGADGGMPGFRNWENPVHMAELADIWNVDVSRLPRWKPPTHALGIFHLAEQSSIRMLWIQCTNPAVSMPDLGRVRAILSNPNLFVVVNEAFPTETTELADVVLPAAIWGEKTGTFTNVDRTVHVSYKAVSPPGEARSDLDIFLDYAKRMKLRDRDGKPLVKWSDAEGAFEAWKVCSKGRPCDYSGMSYKMLTGGSGIQWPCNKANPSGREQLYTDAIFPTSPDACETFGRDLVTGAKVTPEEYKSLNPNGRAFLKSAPYVAPSEEPDGDYPFWLTTGRVVYHFHTRTKTGRSKPLQEAAPDAYVQISKSDAQALGVKNGDWLRIESRRGHIEAPARVGGIAGGRVFVPFHYGYWDDPERMRAANELTLYEWDPVSKQPYFKFAAVKLTPIPSPRSSQPSNGVPSTASDLIEEMKHAAKSAMKKVMPARAHVGDYLGLLRNGEQTFADTMKEVSKAHARETEIRLTGARIAAWSLDDLALLSELMERFEAADETEPRRIKEGLSLPEKESGFSLLRDLHNCWLLACENQGTLTILLRAAEALRDESLASTMDKMGQRNHRQRSWLMTQMQEHASQALTVPE